MIIVIMSIMMIIMIMMPFSGFRHETVSENFCVLVPYWLSICLRNVLGWLETRLAIDTLIYLNII